MNASETAPAIEVTDLSRKFGATLALDQVSLRVKRGRVFGLAGANGAGKTTLIKHLLGRLKPQTGAVRVFGFDPVTDPVAVLGRIGYLSESRDLPPWMRIDELLRYSAAFYPKWDMDYAESLRQQFALAPSATVKTLSRGELAKAGLLIALAYRPELLLLDEPSSGLDPVVRRDILEAIIRTVADEGRTVFFSSHLLEEVERVADDIVMIFHGQVALSGALDEVKERHHRLVFHFDTPPASPARFPGVLSLTGSGREWTAICNGQRDAAVQAVARAGGRLVAEDPASLDDIFVALAAR